MPLTLIACEKCGKTFPVLLLVAGIECPHCGATGKNLKVILGDDSDRNL